MSFTKPRVNIDSEVIQIDWDRPRWVKNNKVLYIIEAQMYDYSWDQIKYIQGNVTSTEIDFKITRPCTFRIIAEYSEKKVYSRESDRYFPGPKPYDLTGIVRDSNLLIDQTQNNCLPKIYKLPFTKRVQTKDVIFGKDSVAKLHNVQEKVIMLVGATGAGKSTLINGIINYIFGVNWVDNIRLQLIVDENKQGPTKSQTRSVTVYKIKHADCLEIPYALTIVDTPGFGDDTSGTNRDKETTDQIQTLFETEGDGGIDHIDAVGFVVQSSQIRLTLYQHYIFDSIQNLFGKDVCENMYMLLTFADSSSARPVVLDTIKELKMDSSNVFSFNNSVLFTENDEMTSENDEVIWDKNKESYKSFLLMIRKVEAKSLTLSKETLRLRNALEAYIAGITNCLDSQLAKMKQLEIEKNVLQKVQANTEDLGKQIKYEVQVKKTIKECLDDGTTAMNCPNCKHTCIHPIKETSWIRDIIKKFTELMFGDECLVCPRRCSGQIHVKERNIYVTKDETESRTNDDIKARYEEEEGKRMNAAQLVAQLTKDVENVQRKMLCDIDNLTTAFEKLNKIALKPSLTMTEYIEGLIEDARMKGNIVNIQLLEKVRQLMAEYSRPNGRNEATQRFQMVSLR